jgi:hypothetical protein
MDRRTGAEEQLDRLEDAIHFSLEAEVIDSGRYVRTHRFGPFSLPGPFFPAGHFP